MHHLRRAAVVAAILVVVGGCKSAGKQESGVEKLSVKEQAWTGTIRAREARTGEATQQKGTVMYQGNVRLTRVDGDISRTNIYIMLSGPPPGSSEGMSWVLASGRCGALETPVLPVSAFDPIDVGSNGRAEKSVTIPFEFPDDGTYHVDFFSGHSARLTDVVACADLKHKN
jgi:hypothetical protein